MIPHYTDLAANERTYLAWMRTALALIAFGFILERFDLFIRAFGKSLSDGKLLSFSPVAWEAGIVLAILGLVIMILSTFRFARTTKLILSENQEPYGFLGVLITGGIFILLALFVLLYISRFLF